MIMNTDFEWTWMEAVMAKFNSLCATYETSRLDIFVLLVRIYFCVSEDK
jgi:hypothetical protein